MAALRSAFITLNVLYAIFFLALIAGGLFIIIISEENSISQSIPAAHNSSSTSREAPALPSIENISLLEWTPFIFFSSSVYTTVLLAFGFSGKKPLLCVFLFLLLNSVLAELAGVGVLLFFFWKGGLNLPEIKCTKEIASLENNRCLELIVYVFSGGLGFVALIGIATVIVTIVLMKQKTRNCDIVLKSTTDEIGLNYYNMNR